MDNRERFVLIAREIITRIEEADGGEWWRDVRPLLERLDAVRKTFDCSPHPACLVIEEYPDGKPRAKAEPMRLMRCRDPLWEKRTLTFLDGTPNCQSSRHLAIRTLNRWIRAVEDSCKVQQVVLGKARPKASTCQADAQEDLQPAANAVAVQPKKKMWVKAHEVLSDYAEQGGTYTSVRNLAERFRFSQKSIGTAIRRSEELQRWKRCTSQVRDVPKVVSFGARAGARLAAKEELPSVDDHELEIALGEILAAAPEEERGKVDAMADIEKRRLAAYYYSREWGADRERKPDRLAHRKP